MMQRKRSRVISGFFVMSKWYILMAPIGDVTRVPFTEREETGGEIWEGNIKNWDWP